MTIDTQRMFAGRPGKRTRQQRIIGLLRKAAAEQDRYSAGGNEKTSRRPITLARSARQCDEHESGTNGA